VRKLRLEIQSLRDKNEDLREELHEARQDFLVVRQERDDYRLQLQGCQRELAAFDSVVQ